MNQLGDRKVYFEFTGGEVTFHPEIDQILKFIKSRDGLTGIISNGSRTLSWWEERLDLFDHVCLSFHPERGEQEHFARVVSLLNQNSSVHVNIMMTPENFDDLNSFGRRVLKDNPGISLSLQPLFEKFTGPIYGYSDEQKRILEKPDLPYVRNPKEFVVRGSMKATDESGKSEIVDPTLLISRGENQWKGWNCAAGLENIVITMSGHVMRGVCSAGGVIGTITDPEFRLPTEPVTCPFEHCHCAFDVMSSKTKV